MPRCAAWRKPSATTLQARSDELAQKIRVALLPKDAMDDRNVVLEIRAGTGGDEASLFAGDLFRMYERFAGLAGLEGRGDLGQRRHRRRLQGNHRRGAGPRRVRKAEIRIRRAPGAARAGHRDAGAHPHLGGDRRGAARGRGGRRRHQERRSADRDHARAGRRRPARQQDRIRRSASPTSRPASW